MSGGVRAASVWLGAGCEVRLDGEDSEHSNNGGYRERRSAISSLRPAAMQELVVLSRDVSGCLERRNCALTRHTTSVINSHD